LARICLLDSYSVGEVFDARIALESALAAEAARIGDTEAWVLMHKHLDAFETAVRGEDWSTAHRTHLDFHLSIIRALRLPARPDHAGAGVR
jgi:GntR family transcriptional repressor for pyruvate dehydrogenase complex